MVSLSRSFPSGKALVTFEINASPQDCEKYMDISDLDVSFDKHKKRRTLNANAYFFVLVGQIAAKTKTTITNIHNRMIEEYGQPEIYEDSSGKHLQSIVMQDGINHLDLPYIHLRMTNNVGNIGNKLYRTYYVMRGSHTYDTAEMSRLIDGTVFEAKELGIETKTPNEIERIKQQWHL